MKKAGDVLGPLVRQLGIEKGMALARLRNDWHAIFDEPLASQMHPAAFSEGELLLTVDSSVWVHQLTYHKRDILGRLRSYGVRDIRFRVGRLPRRQEHVREEPKAACLSEEDKAFVAGLTAEIPDEGLRSILQRAAERSLTVKKS